MTGRRRLDRLTAFYPRAWRERYGDELVALLEDQLEGRRPTLRLRLGLMAAGLREHAEAAGVLGQRAAPIERARAGVLLVLAGWTGFVVAGASFAKLAEHFPLAVPKADRALSVGAFDAVVAAAAVGGALCLLGVAAALPAFFRFLAAGGWRRIARPVRVAALCSVVAAGGVAGLAPWAHSLSTAARNGADPAYSAAFIALALVSVAALVLWARAGTVAFRSLQLSRRTVAAESALATGVALSMAAVTSGVAVWWGSVALHAPWFLGGLGPPQGSAANPQLIGSMALMVAALGLGLLGVVRIGRAWVRGVARPTP